MNVPALLIALAFLAVLVLIGRRLASLLASPEDGLLYRGTLYLLAGAVLFHLLVTVLDLIRVPWHPLLLGGLLVLLLLVIRVPRKTVQRTSLSGFDWGDGVALFVLAVYTALALTGWIAIPDFVFHWGIKGYRFFISRGVDYAYLAREWNWVVHPDYPNLLPEMFAATALFTGRFDMPAMMLETCAFFAGLLACCREALRQGGAGPFTRQAGLALIALAIGAFAIGHIMAGGADWMIPLALAAALPPLLREPDRAGDFQVATAAAFAAGSKVEGVPLAAFLLAVQWGRRLWRERRFDLQTVRTALLLGVPAALVALPWLGRNLHHHLFLTQINSGPFTPSRAGAIAAASFEALQTPAWHGFLWTMFLPLPLLLVRRARPFAVVALLQVLFYFYVYFTSGSAAEPRYFILSNFARLGFHVVPASLAAAMVVWMGEPQKENPPLPVGEGGFAEPPGAGSISEAS